MNAWISKTGRLCPIVEPAVASQLKTLPFSLEVDWADCGVSHEAQMQSVSFPRNQSPFCQDLMSWKGARGRRESSWSSHELLGGSSSGGGGGSTACSLPCEEDSTTFEHHCARWTIFPHLVFIRALSETLGGIQGRTNKETDFMMASHAQRSEKWDRPLWQGELTSLYS